MGSFWKNLKKPIIGLAPMDGVTDPAMRHIQALIAKPDVFFTEQISVEALVKAPEKTAHRLVYAPAEQPIICQLSGYNPDYFFKACRYVLNHGFAGIDINLGCPVKSTDRHGGHRGAGLIGEYETVVKIVNIARSAISKTALENDKAGLSVKTRTGAKTPITDKWLGFLSQMPVDAIILHGRTHAQGFSGKANWGEIEKGAKIAKAQGKIFLGNGDVQTSKEAKEKCAKYHLDGVLIGRAAMGNPWVFDGAEIAVPLRLSVMLQHARYFNQIRGDEPFVAIRKHLGWYCKNFPHSKQLRFQLVRADNFSQMRQIVDKWAKNAL